MKSCCNNKDSMPPTCCYKIKNPVEKVYLNKETMEVFDENFKPIGKGEYKNGILVIKRN